MSPMWKAIFGLLVYCLLMAIAWISDFYDWNNGVCRKCGNRLRHFDNDSQGGRGYTCGKGHYTWVSWPGVGEEKP